MINKARKIIEELDLDELNVRPQIQQLLAILLNFIETLLTEISELKAERQQLRDEINRLKGEQGKPKIKANKKPQEEENDSEKSKQEETQEAKYNKYSSDEERHEAKEHKRAKKEVKVDRIETLSIEPEELPNDAEFKGYEEIIVQDVKIITDNVLFKRAKYYSASTGRTYLAPLPSGISGHFGPTVRALILMLYFGCRMTQPKISEFLDNFGVIISTGQLSNLLIKGHEDFHQENEKIFKAALSESPWQQIDETGMRVNGKNHYAFVVCNELYTIYQTTPRKNRQTVIDVLRHSRERFYRINDEALSYLERARLAKKKRQQIAQLPLETDFTEQEFLALLSPINLGPKQTRTVLDGAYIAYYHAQKEWPIVQTLVCDDAGQFKGVTKELMLCWVHDARHYKKLMPVIGWHRKKLDQFMQKYWQYYHDLKKYCLASNPSEKKRLESRFDDLFSTKTTYEELDDRIAKTRSKKDELLLVLDHPELPLHNNTTERGARTVVCKLKVSTQTRTQQGTRAWNTFMSLVDTTKKLGVSFFDYVDQHIRGSPDCPNLPELIRQRSRQMKLGASWQKED